MNRLLLFPLLLITNFIFGQKNSADFKNGIMTSQSIEKADIKADFYKHDISFALTQTKNDRVFGFIGDNFQRIRLKLISVIKNKENPSQYFVYGKSMVKENVCEFQGTLTITNAFNLKPNIPGTKQGVAIGEYLFYENPLQKHTGKFKGVFRSDWYLDKEGNLKYDDLLLGADGFSNNEFVGIWTNYSGTITKTCNWGDERIPMSGDFDIGAAYFIPAKVYRANGWDSYYQAYVDELTKDTQAKKSETKEWWK